jgi:hypothetical protein
VKLRGSNEDTAKEICLNRHVPKYVRPSGKRIFVGDIWTFAALPLGAHIVEEPLGGEFVLISIFVHLQWLLCFARESILRLKKALRCRFLQLRKKSKRRGKIGLTEPSRIPSGSY